MHKAHNYLAVAASRKDIKGSEVINHSDSLCQYDVVFVLRSRKIPHRHSRPSGAEKLLPFRINGMKLRISRDRVRSNYLLTKGFRAFSPFLTEEGRLAQINTKNENMQNCCQTDESSGEPRKIEANENIGVRCARIFSMFRNEIRRGRIDFEAGECPVSEIRSLSNFTLVIDFPRPAVCFLQKQHGVVLAYVRVSVNWEYIQLLI